MASNNTDIIIMYLIIQILLDAMALPLCGPTPKVLGLGEAMEIKTHLLCNRRLIVVRLGFSPPLTLSASAAERLLKPKL